MIKLTQVTTENLFINILCFVIYRRGG